MTSKIKINHLHIIKTLINIFSTIFILSCVLLIACTNNPIREKKLKKEAVTIIKRIETYKLKENKLPNNLKDLGLKERDGYNTIYYMKRDSVNFTISFPISAESHLFYYSDTKTWEKGFRKMKR